MDTCIVAFLHTTYVHVFVCCCSMAFLHAGQALMNEHHMNPTNADTNLLRRMPHACMNTMLRHYIDCGCFNQQAVRMYLHNCEAVVAIQRQALHFMHHTVQSLDIFGRGNLLSSSTVTTQSCSHSVKVTVSPWPSFACACSCHAGSPCKSTIDTFCTDVCAGLRCACLCHAGLPRKHSIY